MLAQIVNFSVREQALPVFADALLRDRDGARNEEVGFLEMRVFEDITDATKLWAYEVIADQAALEQHRTKDYTKEVGRVAQEALTTAPTFYRLTDPRHAETLMVGQGAITIIESSEADDLVDAITSLVSTHAGNLRFDVHRDRACDTRIITYELWDSLSAARAFGAALRTSLGAQVHITRTLLREMP